eukprot:2635462-Pyramimonas_sp.AAC.1
MQSGGAGGGGSNGPGDEKLEATKPEEASEEDGGTDAGEMRAVLMRRGLAFIERVAQGRASEIY